MIIELEHGRKENEKCVELWKSGSNLFAALPKIHKLSEIKTVYSKIARCFRINSYCSNLIQRKIINWEY